MTWAAPIEPAPAGLKEVHIIGMKYTDYFTDGSTTIAVPGYPAIDSNFDKPDAPIPTHEGMTWVHTTGAWLYDTPSGDLAVPDASTSTVAASSDNSASTTSADSTTSPAL
jgi:hypothetical protein